MERRLLRGWGRHTAVSQDGATAIGDEGEGLGETPSNWGCNGSAEEGGKSSNGELHYDDKVRILGELIVG